MCFSLVLVGVGVAASMKVPPKRKGNCGHALTGTVRQNASMKVPPKRKGNFGHKFTPLETEESLNESPSEKEGK